MWARRCWLPRHRCRCTRRRCIPSRFGAAAARCSWHSFWSSPIASGTRASWTCVRFPPRLVPSRLVSFAQHPRPFPLIGTYRTPARSILERELVRSEKKVSTRERSRYLLSRIGDISVAQFYRRAGSVRYVCI